MECSAEATTCFVQQLKLGQMCRSTAGLANLRPAVVLSATKAVVVNKTSIWLSPWTHHRNCMKIREENVKSQWRNQYAIVSKHRKTSNKTF